jgi:hypothetical protein
VQIARQAEVSNGPPLGVPLPLPDWARCLALLIAAFLLGLLASALRPCRAAEILLPTPPLNEPIVISADEARVWRTANDQWWWLQGNCVIQQGRAAARGEQAVLRFSPGRYGEPQHRFIAYLEGNVFIEFQQASQWYQYIDAAWCGQFESTSGIVFRTMAPQGLHGGAPEIAARAERAFAQQRRDGTATRQYNAWQYAPSSHALDAAARHIASAGSLPATPAHWSPTSHGGGSSAGAQRGQPDVQPAQFTVPQAEVAGAEDLPPPRGRRIRAWPRHSGTPVQATWFPNEARNEWVAVIDSGINIVVDGVEQLGSVDILTDRLVIWTSGAQQPNLGGTIQSRDTPLEFYLEGNIVFRQGERIVKANRMYYDVTREVGIVLDAELLTPVPNYQGLLRLKADVLQQTGRDRYVASNAFLTSSRMGVPSYRLAAGTVYVEDRQQAAIDPASGAPLLDPQTGQSVIDHQRYATSLNNVLFLGEVPVFYWPILSGNLERSDYYLRRFRLRNDNIFGTQVLTDWDLYQLLGIDNPPPASDWTLSVDYLSERGLGHGTNFRYQGLDLLGIPSSYAGVLDAWAIEDSGEDTLGAGRVGLEPEKDYRFRLFGRHRWDLPDDFRLTGELGWISDRNFLEQYFEQEWDQFKDQTTGLELKQTRDNVSWGITADVQINRFFTQTQGVQAKHFWLGQPLLNDTLTWYEHSKVGFLDLNVARPPENLAEQLVFAPLPWEADVRGGRYVTRQEIDLPLQIGPFKLTAYLGGELAHWDQDLTGNDLDRALGRVGVRATLPLWAVNPGIENHLFNVHGVAHKVLLEVDASWAEATRDLTLLPLYDPLDDDAQEHFRRRFQFNTFGGPPVPLRFDERFYALRSGLQDWVTSPVTEIADDLTAVRLGVHQRWQTKRGLPGQRRTVDWIVLDTDVAFFPEEDRDNFGEPFGLAGYDFRWHVGDRVTVRSDGLADFFPDGLKLWRVSLHYSRPPRGAFYIDFRSLNGPIESQVVSFSYSYFMSPKWASSFSTSYDFGPNQNIGQRLSITRIGESFLMTFGFDIDHSKDNFGVNLAIEPRFLPGLAFGQFRSGVRVPPAGAFGVE